MEEYIITDTEEKHLHFAFFLLRYQHLYIHRKPTKVTKVIGSDIN